jgi:tripartite-type tricarboxylate transporter receptor subunit TctC
MKKAKIPWVIFVALMQVAFMVTQIPTTVGAAEKDFIRLIAPNAVGSGVDFTARLMSEGLGKALGKNVVVENLPGAGGVVGTQQLVRAPKDGSTIGMVSDNHVIIPSIYKDLPYDPIKDITAISIMTTNTLVLVTNMDLPVKNVQDLIQLAKSQPGKLTYGSAGNGTVLHLAAALFCSEAGVNITHVPYKGGGQLVTDVVGGHVNMGVIAMASVAGQIKAGKLRALAVTTQKRTPEFAEVPTMVEAGLPNYRFDSWVACIAPANLPQLVVQRLNAAVLQTLTLKEVREGLLAQGMTTIGTSPEEAKRHLETDLASKAKIVKESGARLE